jgi:excisionase family DNA binding protein
MAVATLPTHITTPPRAIADNSESPPRGLSLSFDLPYEILRGIAEEAARIVLERTNGHADAMTTKQVASYLCCPKKRIDNLCGADAIPYRMVGGRRAFNRQEIDAWYAQQPGVTLETALMSL